MGRVVNAEHSYQVKNTFVELVPADVDEDDFSRNQRTRSDMDAPASRPDESPSYIPQTPSPFLSCQPDPIVMPYAMDLLGSSAMPINFGSFGVEDACVPAFNLGDAQTYFQYDPNTGAFMPYEYTYMPYDPSCFVMQDKSQMQEEGNPDEHTQVLLSALSEKISETKIEVSGESTLEAAVSANGTSEDMKGWEGGEESWGGANVDCWEGGAWNQEGNYGGYGNEDPEMQQTSSAGRRRAERREARRQERGGAGGASYGSESQGQSRSHTVQDAWQNANDRQVVVTTVMFRNIPNKYTREMLVKQLDEDMRGEFDFVYLPIDFKNKCNVGYAFINFRTVEACETFVNRFNGMEVRKCLPGLNSRKVTEVTPARVQGFDENVQRLRNSPVMRELMHKPEWMPLIFGHDGEQVPFPSPERSLEPIKPRRRAREDEMRYYD